jgi:hypothetical protein
VVFINEANIVDGVFVLQEYTFHVLVRIVNSDIYDTREGKATDENKRDKKLG